MRRMDYEERISVRVSQDLADRIDQDAQRDGVKRSDVIRTILATHYEVTE